MPAGEPVTDPAQGRPDAPQCITSVHPQETSVSDGVIATFLAEKPASQEEQKSSIALTTAGLKWRHGCWQGIRTKIHASLVRTNQSSSRISSFCSCGCMPYIQVAANDATDYRIQASTCHDRLCTPCANTRSRRIQQTLLSILPNTPVLFITLTLCGKGESLSDLLDRLYKHFRALRAHPTWSERITGGAAFLEVKWNTKASRWHPHLHIVAEGSYTPQHQLSDAWRSISHDSFIVDIRRARMNQNSSTYVSKYASKPLNATFLCNSERLDEAVIALKGRRLCMCFGSWYGTPLDHTMEEEELDELLGDKQWVNVCTLSDYLDGLAATQLIDSEIAARLRISEIRMMVHAHDSS